VVAPGCGKRDGRCNELAFRRRAGEPKALLLVLGASVLRLMRMPCRVREAWAFRHCVPSGSWALPRARVESRPRGFYP
jgi:hypothetical protein